MMDRVLTWLPLVRCYIDNILVFNKNGKKHLKHLTIFLVHKVEHDLKLHPSKSIFFYLQVEYLEHIIYLKGLGVLKSKVEALTSIPRPKDMS